MHKLFQAAMAAGLLLAAAAGAPNAAYAFGALAVQQDGNHDVGWSHDYKSRDDADEEASEQCGPDCNIVVDFASGCAAYARDVSGDTTYYGWATDSSKSDAQSRAIGECSDRGGDECKVTVWACD